MRIESNPYRRIIKILSLIEDQLIETDSTVIFLDSLPFGGLDMLQKYDSVFSKLIRDEVISDESIEVVENEVLDPLFPYQTLTGYRFNINRDAFFRYKFNINELAANHNQPSAYAGPNSKPMFIPNRSELQINGISLRVTPATIGHYICLVVLSKELGEQSTEQEILDAWGGEDSATRPRSIYDASRRLNKAVKNRFEIEKMFTCKCGLVWVTEGLFNNS